MNKQTITSTGKDYSKGVYWVLDKIEFGTRAEQNKKELPLMLSGTELLLDALHNHQYELIKEYEILLDLWVKDERATVESLKKALSEGDFVRQLYEIKTISGYLNVIATDLAASLREIGNSLREQKGGEK